MESKKNDDYDDGYKKVEMVDIKPDTTTESTDISTEKEEKEKNKMRTNQIINPYSDWRVVMVGAVATFLIHLLLPVSPFLFPYG